MSHGAIIARELGVPCVIGTQTGTAQIRTGDLLVVDGSRGTVSVAAHPDGQPHKTPLAAIETTARER
jgi:pyruvate,water dikinase